MNEQPERPFIAVQIPTGAGRATAVGVHAPIGAVSRKDRNRAGRTALRREGEDLVLETALPGTVSLQRRAPGGTWDTVEAIPSAHTGQTRLELPRGVDGPATYRVVFTPKNEDINTWISPDVLP